MYNWHPAVDGQHELQKNESEKTVSAIGIYLLNNIHRNVFVNIGAGVWDTYNMATDMVKVLHVFLICLEAV